MQRPPYLRWAAAGLLLLGALLWDLRSSPTTLHPFLTAGIGKGESIPAEAVEWRRAPDGLLPMADPALGIAATDLAAGDPVMPSSLTTAPVVPEDWWLVPVTIGTHARPGDAVLLVIVDPPTSVPGTVITAQSGDRYSTGFRPAAVAVPGDAAPLVAAAAQQGMVVAAVRP